MDKDQLNTLLSGTGLMSSGGGFNWPNIIAGIIFGVIGFAAFSYGKKETAVKPMVIGIILMVYPYFIANTAALFAVGIILTAALFFWRD